MSQGSGVVKRPCSGLNLVSTIFKLCNASKVNLSLPNFSLPDKWEYKLLQSHSFVEMILKFMSENTNIFLSSGSLFTVNIFSKERRVIKSFYHLVNMYI